MKALIQKLERTLELRFWAPSERIIHRLFLQADSIEKEREFHNKRKASTGDGIGSITQSVLHDMQVLDTKSSALLQFISVVLASLTFSFGLIDNLQFYAGFIRAGLFFYMLSFSFAAWASLRCLNIMGPPHMNNFNDAAEYEKHILEELTKRRVIYFFSLRITMSTFMMLVPFVFLWVLLKIII